MYKSIRRGLAAASAVGLLGAGVVLAGANAAVASTGDWGYGALGSGILHPGVNAIPGVSGGTSKFSVAVGCFSVNGCQFDPTMVIVGNALNGTTIPAGRTFTLDSVQPSGASAAVGTCHTSRFQVVCQPTTTGSVGDEGTLLMVGTLDINVPSNLPNGTPVFALNWRDDSGESGNFDSNDVFTRFVVINPAAPASHHHRHHHHGRPGEPEDNVPSSDKVVRHVPAFPVGGVHAGEGGAQSSVASGTQPGATALGAASILTGVGLGLRRRRI